jgi:endonuclease/exonuclease/phosphatase (EEP) superfamily protein YafD
LEASDDFDYALLNDGELTFFSPPPKRASTIDLAWADSQSAHLFELEIGIDFMGSDHLPLLVNFNVKVRGIPRSITTKLRFNREQ